jgi:hypothetical protein
MEAEAFEAAHDSLGAAMVAVLVLELPLPRF